MSIPGILRTKTHVLASDTAREDLKTEVSSLCNMGDCGQNRLEQIIFRFDGLDVGFGLRV